MLLGLALRLFTQPKSVYKSFYDPAFRGLLSILMLVMGMEAWSRIGELRKVAQWYVVYSVVAPFVHGLIAFGLGMIAHYTMNFSMGGVVVLAIIAIILLFEIGLESDLRQLKEVGIQATVVACVGVAAPFAAGTAGLMMLFHVAAIPTIFAGAALTATSIGITSKVLSELGQLKSREGQIIVGAAVIDDVLGIIVLAVVASLAKTGEIDVANVIYLIVSATAFLIGSILLGGIFNKSFVAIVDQLKTSGNIRPPAKILLDR
jgi:Kef-type K+ transport system membrane component KefB